MESCLHQYCGNKDSKYIFQNDNLMFSHNWIQAPCGPQRQPFWKMAGFSVMRYITQAETAELDLSLALALKCD